MFLLSVLLRVYVMVIKQILFSQYLSHPRKSSIVSSQFRRSIIETNQSDSSITSTISIIRLGTVPDYLVRIFIFSVNFRLSIRVALLHFTLSSKFVMVESVFSNIISRVISLLLTSPASRLGSVLHATASTSRLSTPRADILTLPSPCRNF